MNNSINKIGIVAMPRISVGGGFPRATRDLIAALDEMGKEVVLLTPFHVNMDKIAELYGPIKLKKIIYPHKLATFFSRDDMLGRKLIKREFKRLANEVDFIIDLDGCVLHNSLPGDFDRNRYVIWRLSCINPETYKLQKVKDPKVLLKMLTKRTIKKMITRKKDIPRGVRIYPVDEWTEREIIKFWKIQPEKMCLYPEIKVEEFNPNKKKKDQAVILGRIASNKEINKSIEIFHEGTRNFPDYKLVVIGGTTPDSKNYLVELRSLIKKLKIEKKVIIRLDPSFEEIKRVLGESKVIIDSQIGTSMNMPVIEAMASGCIPIMRKYSGTYMEILANGRYGFGFDTVEEGARALERVLTKKKLDNKDSIKRAQFFSSAKFKERLKKILKTAK